MSYTPHNNDKASGVAIVISPQLAPYIREIRIHTGRIMELILSTAGAPSHLISTYAPHQGTTVDHLRAPYWNKLTNVISNIPKTHFTSIFRDLNVRLEAILSGEEHIIGPKLFGKGMSALTDPSTPWDPNRPQGSNRGPAMELCEGQEMVFANTFKAPTQERTVSYRDKLQKTTNIYTPQGHNVLDHVLTHRKWLAVIKDIRNRPDISFPADHFIVQTTLRIKLGAKNENTKNTETYELLL